MAATDSWSPDVSETVTSPGARCCSMVTDEAQANSPLGNASIRETTELVVVALPFVILIGLVITQHRIPWSRRASRPS